ncbi:MAG: hypothetical protein R2729_04280 [Bryobacteraceae bacterium]
MPFAFPSESAFTFGGIRIQPKRLTDALSAEQFAKWSAESLQAFAFLD